MIDILQQKLQKYREKIRKSNNQKLFLFKLLDEPEDKRQSIIPDQVESIQNEFMDTLDDEDYHIKVSNNYVQNIHSYARQTQPPKRKEYRCKNCSFVTAKKSTLDVHAAENCVTSVVKDMVCIICRKKFNYRRLRLHFNYFITKLEKPEAQQQKPNGAHANFDLSYHKHLLRQLKMSKTV